MLDFGSTNHRFRIFFSSIHEDPEGAADYLSNWDNAFLAKFNRAGQVQWYQEIGGVSGDQWYWHVSFAEESVLNWRAGEIPPGGASLNNPGSLFSEFPTSYPSE